MIMRFLPYLSCYKVLQKTKLESCPDRTQETENCAEASLLDYTDESRLRTYLEEVVQ